MGKATKNVKKVITGIRQEYSIEDVTIIDGHHIIYSGAFDGFYAKCDPTMILYRNEVLKRIVAEKVVFNHRRLFLFLEPAETEEEVF